MILVQRQPDLSRLHVWLDFTDDPSRVGDVLQRHIASGHSPGAVELTGGAPHVLTPGRAASLSSIEEALRAVGEVLGTRPGARTVLIVGHGLGTWAPRLGAVEMDPGFEQAVAALHDARVSVFCIDGALRPLCRAARLGTRRAIGFDPPDRSPRHRARQADLRGAMSRV